MTFGIYTLGCRVNQYESRVIAEKLTENGYTECSFSSVCDIYIINSCAVTAESVRKSRQMIRRAKKMNPKGKVIVTGCFAQIAPDTISDLDIADHIIGNKQKLADILSALNSDFKTISAEPVGDAEYENYSLTEPTRTREYIKIQDGCNGKCAYCVIPAARGPVRSKPRENVIEEIKHMAAKGVKEVILTGIEIASYQYGLAELLEEIDRIEGIERISMGSLEPTLITEEFANKLAKINKLTPHFHISVQSGSTAVLNRMRRKYNAAMLEQSINILKERFSDLQLTCDIIVGFPGETDAEFEETKAFLLRNKFFHAHIFTYSKRPGTLASEMPDQVPESIKISRSAILDKQQKDIKSELLNTELKRRNVPVLFETYKNGINSGHSDNYIEYELSSDSDLSGKIIYLDPSSTDGEKIISK